YWQIIKGRELSKEASENQTLGRDITPKRGTIYDRNGKELAISVSVNTIWVNPEDVEGEGLSTRQIAEGLSEILEKDVAEILEILTKNSSWTTLIKKIDTEIGDKVGEFINKNDISGISVEEDTRRYYPQARLACHIIGFTGDENQGLEGLESMLENYLKGLPGKVISDVDAGGHEIPLDTKQRIEPQDGLNAVLTIDETIQYFVENALEKAIADNSVVNGATAIVMDPDTGDILAMASKPGFNLNEPFAAPDAQWLKVDYDLTRWTGKTEAEVNILRDTVWNNLALTYTYEPGSTFKAITSAAGLEENVIKPETMVTDSPVELAGYTLECWSKWPHGEETFREGVYNSCNPVFIRVAQSLGLDRFYKYMRAFGFYDKTGMILPEENSIIHAKPQEIDMATASFGQSFQITPIQMISAYCAIANGGSLMQPRIVKELTDNEGNIIKTFEPAAVRNVISEETCKTLLDILEGVVSEGTGKNAYVSGYRVAGKTGTSQTLPRESDRYIASFAAIAPADDPEICVLVILDNPKGFSHMGGVIAAPVAGDLVEDILTYLNVERNYTDKDRELMTTFVNVPNMINMKVSDAVSYARAYGLSYSVESAAGSEGGDALVIEQNPKAGTSVMEQSVVILYAYKPENEISVKVPDLKDMTAAEATKALRDVSLNIKTSGTGTVISQSSEKGSLITKGSIVEVELRNFDNIE
ncbi:MAG: penicillin-binding transpeptidase domain-containing protein, partial [Eubacteriales bacterium]|nr:penicillin-binding transpeptidase domain-containing protein [Eubacteriales bacterium]